MNCLPGQLWGLQASSALLFPWHFRTGLSLLMIFVLLFVRAPPSQEAEHAPNTQLLHSQFIGVARYAIVSFVLLKSNHMRIQIIESMFYNYETCIIKKLIKTYLDSCHKHFCRMILRAASWTIGLFASYTH